VIVLGKTFAKGVPGVLLLQVTGVWKQHLTKLMGRFGTKDLAFESVFDQRWQIAAVVNMGMGQYDAVNRGGGFGKPFPVAAPQHLDALIEPTVDENAMAVRLHEMPRARDRVDAAQKP
jgi:hypothetical protein